METIKKFHSHIKKYHRHYFFGLLWSVVVLKITLVLWILFGVIEYGVQHKILAESSSGTVLSWDNLTGDALTWDVLTGDNLTGDNLTGDILTWDVLTGDNLTGDILTWDVLTGDDFTGDNLTGDIFTGDDLTGDVFTGDDLTGDIFTGDDLTGDVFTGDDLTGDDLTGDVFTGDVLTWDTLTGNNFSGDIDTGNYVMFVAHPEDLTTSWSDNNSGDTNTWAIDLSGSTTMSWDTIMTWMTETGTIQSWATYSWNLNQIHTWENAILSFKRALYNYQVCKQQVAIKEVHVEIYNDTYSLFVPQFESQFLSHISVLFSKLILDKIKENRLAQDEIDEVIHNFNNFLVILKLLRDDDISCKQNLSNYYINKFQNSLIRYGIFGWEK